MSIVSIFVGQCGNQLGSDLLTHVAEAAASSKDESYQHAVSTTFFRRGKNDSALPTARAVQIDMEPKVIESCRAGIQRKGLFHMSNDCITKDEGSANNWAFGYFGQGASRKDSIVDAVRREVECCDALSGINVTHSVAGGTGSGVGCLTSDVIRDCFPRVTLQHTVVWPFERGEVMTQWINATLTINVLNETADAIAVLSNDDAAAWVANRKSTGEKLAPTLTAYGDLNRVMAAQVACLMAPRFNVALPPAPAPPRDARRQRSEERSPPVQLYRVASQFQDNIEAVAFNPRRKFFTGVLSDFPGGERRLEDSWPTATGSVIRHLNRSKSESQLLILRGRGAASEGVSSLLTNDQNICMREVQIAETHAWEGAGAIAAGYQASSDVGSKISRGVSVVENFVDCGAFLHHYDNHGVDLAMMEDAILHCWSVADSYISE